MSMARLETKMKSDTSSHCNIAHLADVVDVVASVRGCAIPLGPLALTAAEHVEVDGANGLWCPLLFKQLLQRLSKRVAN